jgi:membrane fusion protein (multidrug efflux system)
MPTPFARSLRSLDADRLRGMALTFVVAGVLLASWIVWFVLGRLSVYEVTDRARLEVNQAVHPVDARVEGRVMTTQLILGREVREGDVLIELDADEQRLRLEEEQTRLAVLSPRAAAIASEISAEEQALEAAQRAARAALDEARSQLAESEAPARFAEVEAARVATLRGAGLVSEIEELRTRAESDRRRAASDSLRLAVQRLERSQLTEEQDRRVRLERLRSEQVRLRGEMATSTSAVRRLENEIERRRVRAPISGRLGEVSELRIGGFVAEGQKLGAIVPTGRLKVVAEFEPASALGRIRQGQPARLRLVGFPWTEYGSVRAVVETVAEEVRSGTVRVELSILRDDASAVPFQHGLPGAVEVEVERLSPAALVLRAGGRLLMRPLTPPVGAPNSASG